MQNKVSEVAGEVNKVAVQGSVTLEPEVSYTVRGGV
jgi:hypothetical protein